MNLESPVRLFGVTHHKERRSLKKHLSDEERQDILSWCGSIENVCPAFFAVQLSLLKKQRHVGTRPTAKEAARLYDSALFHLWGFVYRPSPNRFNFYRGTEGPGELTPQIFPEVRELKLKLSWECRKRGLELSAFDFTYADSLVLPE